jgi:hypothetical protein
MKNHFVILFTVLSLNSYAQLDTIYTNNKKIACNVKEITNEAVKFSYSGEEMVNSLYSKLVQKILFKSGRIQIFNETTAYKKVTGADDFNKVTITSVENEVIGLVNLEDITSKAQAGTVFANMEKVKEKAIKKLKIKAAMLGANIIYLSQSQTTGFSVGNTGYTKSLEGIAYSNILPNFDEFIHSIGNKTTFQTEEKIKFSSHDDDFSPKEFSKNVILNKIYNENGLIMINATITGVPSSLFRVIDFTNSSYTLVWKDKDIIYNIKVKI